MPHPNSDGLAPCPFCGAPPVREAHPEAGGILRFACRAERCAVQPATEYLLEEHTGSLRNAWNRRWTPDGTPRGAPRHTLKPIRAR